MKRAIAFLGLLFVAAGGVRAQTQVDRVAATQLVNRSIPTLVGTTPDVSLGNVFFTSSNGTISNFINGTLSQQIWVICADTNTAIAPGTIVTSGGTLNCQVNTVYSFIFNGTGWVESGTGSGGGGGGSGSPGLPNSSVQFACGGAFCGDSRFIWAPGSGLAIGGGAAYTHTFQTGTNGLNSLQLTPNAVSIAALETGDNLGFQSSGNTSFTIGAAHAFNLPTTSGTAGTVLMSNGANPQVTSWSNAFTNGLSAPMGTFTTDVNPFNLSFTLNNASQVFNGVVWTATNTAYGAGSLDYQFCAGASGTACLTVDPLGRVASANQVGSGDGSAAGNLEMSPGAIPTVLTNNVGWMAPATVSNGFVIAMPSAPCAGVFNIYSTSTNYGTSGCSGGANNSSAATAQTGSLSAFTLCSAANCPSGEYRIDVHANSTQVCASVGSAALAFTITYTDNAGTKTAQTVPLVVNGAASLSLTEALGDTTHTAYGYALIGSTGVNPIQLATTLAACTTGTAQYSYSAEVTRIR